MTKEQKIKELEKWMKYAQFLVYNKCFVIAAPIVDRIEVLKIELDYND